MIPKKQEATAMNYNGMQSQKENMTVIIGIDTNKVCVLCFTYHNSFHANNNFVREKNLSSIIRWQL